jgi:hypothetical protein
MAVKKTRNPTPDDATFLFLAKFYAARHTRMAKSQVRAAPAAAGWHLGDSRRTLPAARAAGTPTPSLDC